MIRNNVSAAMILIRQCYEGKRVLPSAVFQREHRWYCCVWIWWMRNSQTIPVGRTFHDVTQVPDLVIDRMPCLKRWSTDSLSQKKNRTASRRTCWLYGRKDFYPLPQYGWDPSVELGFITENPDRIPTSATWYKTDFCASKGKFRLLVKNILIFRASE